MQNLTPTMLGMLGQVVALGLLRYFRWLPGGCLLSQVCFHHLWKKKNVWHSSMQNMTAEILEVVSCCQGIDMVFWVVARCFIACPSLFTFSDENVSGICQCRTPTMLYVVGCCQHVAIWLLRYICTFICTFIRCFYPKRLTVHSGFNFFISMCISTGNLTHNLLRC